MPEFALTFGSRYRTEEHPVYAPADPDGWVTVVAPNYRAARELVVDRIGAAWCDITPLDERFPRDLFPLGEIDRWEVETEDPELAKALVAHALGMPTVVENSRQLTVSQAARLIDAMESTSPKAPVTIADDPWAEASQ